MSGSEEDLKLKRHLETIRMCLNCSEEGQSIYIDLPDRSLDGSNTWILMQCPNCHHAWLSPRYFQSDQGLAYEGYSDVHWSESRPFSTSKWKRLLKEAYFSVAYGYPFEDWVALRYLGYLVRFSPLSKMRLDRQVRGLKFVRNGRLLDIGSGAGWFLQNMQALGWTVEGVDVDPVSVAKAQRRGVTVHCGELEDLNYPESTFDAVTLCHSLEHVHEPLRLLQEIQRILVPNGTVVIITPNIGSLGHRLFNEAWVNLDAPRHLHIFSTESLSGLVAKTGLYTRYLQTSTVRAASDWQTSMTIRDTGCYKPSTTVSLRRKARALAFFLTESICLRAGRDLGEEIVFVGYK